MSPFGDMKRQHDNTWHALADSTRRELLDLLRDKPHTTGELCEQFPALSRTNVMKHLDILEEAGLIVVERQGQHRWNHLNPEPLQECKSWLDQQVRNLAKKLLRLKQYVEKQQKEKKHE